METEDDGFVTVWPAVASGGTEAQHEGCNKALHRSFPEAGDGRPLPPMGDELMTAGLSADDARFVAVQLAQNGLTLVSADWLARAERAEAQVAALREAADYAITWVRSDDPNKILLEAALADTAAAAEAYTARIKREAMNEAAEKLTAMKYPEDDLDGFEPVWNGAMDKGADAIRAAGPVLVEQKKHHQGGSK